MSQFEPDIVSNSERLETKLETRRELEGDQDEAVTSDNQKQLDRIRVSIDNKSED